MANNRSLSRTNCLVKAITASAALAQAPGPVLALLLLMLATATFAKASPLGSVTNIIVGTNFVPTDLRIDGPGYFVVRDPVSGVLSATRFGDFSLDANGFLVTAFGTTVQGFNDSALTMIGDIKIDGTGWQGTNSPPPSVSEFQIQTDGRVVVEFPDGSSMVRCQILLQNFQNPAALSAQGWQCFGWSASAGAAPKPEPPGTSGTNFLVIGQLEQLVPQLQLSLYAGPPQSFSQGVLVPTGNPTDLGIEGGGFFVLRRTNDNAFFATRAGAFYLDGSGYLVHYSGLRLQGYADSSLTTTGDVLIDPAGMLPTNDPGAGVVAFETDTHGKITENLSDGSFLVRAQILLASCSNPDLVVRTNFDLYPIAPNTGLWSPLQPPFTGNLGWLVAGAVELSQFDTNLLMVRSNLNFFSQGPVIITGLPSNLAISGPGGFFTVRDPVANTLYATRWGGFQLDALNHLVTTNGLRLEGLSNSDLTQTGDITIDATGAPDPTLQLTNFFVDYQGNVVVLLSDGSRFVRGRVLLQYYRNPQGLSPAGNGLYSNLTSAMPIYTNALSSYVPPGTIIGGALEQPPNPPPILQLPPARGWRLFINNLACGTVQSSSDMIHWDTLGQVNGSPDLNVAEYFDTEQTTNRFYRVVKNY